MNTNPNAIHELSDLEAADIEGGLTYNQCVSLYTIAGGVAGGLLGGMASFGSLTPIATGLGAAGGLSIGSAICKTHV
jgi:hypothetical protein